MLRPKLGCDSVYNCWGFDESIWVQIGVCHAWVGLSAYLLGEVNGLGWWSNARSVYIGTPCTRFITGCRLCLSFTPVPSLRRYVTLFSRYQRCLSTSICQTGMKSFNWLYAVWKRAVTSYSEPWTGCKITAWLVDSSEWLHATCDFRSCNQYSIRNKQSKRVTKSERNRLSGIRDQLLWHVAT